MTISAKILADSINGNPGPRLVTWELEYPRFIHAQLMTHRQFSRNAQSSRAIPTSRLIKRLLDDPVVPLEWGINKPGMEASEFVTDPIVREGLGRIWDNGLGKAMRVIELLEEKAEGKLHKQIVNRLLEPWAHIKVIVSSTYHENFFHLRCSEHAQPEIRMLAEEMRRLYHASTPHIMKFGQWHLPLITDEEFATFAVEDLKMISVARCARVSYLSYDGGSDAYKDMLLHDKLAESSHYSPFEHVATPTISPYVKYGNFRGWRQYRTFFPNECARDAFTKVSEDGTWEYLEA